MDKTPYNMNELFDVQYAGPATDTVVRFACRLCGEMLYDYKIHGNEAPESISNRLVAHLKEAHNVNATFHMCNDPGCKNRN